MLPILLSMRKMECSLRAALLPRERTAFASTEREAPVPSRPEISETSPGSFPCSEDSQGRNKDRPLNLQVAHLRRPRLEDHPLGLAHRLSGGIKHSIHRPVIVNHFGPVREVVDLRRVALR